MIESTKIELLKNLSQHDFGEEQYFDFHNDYDCTNISFSREKVLQLEFRNLNIEEKIVHMNFFDVRIVLFEFFNFAKVRNLTIDNIYRGRVVSNGKLVEYNYENSGYYYVEFDEGQRLEFWCKGIDVFPH